MFQKGTPMRHSIFLRIGLFVVALTALGVRQASAQGSIESDRDALIALYDATGGDNWHDNTNWKSDRPLGEWYGVRTNEQGRVDSLLFRNNKLTGRIPAEINVLDNLELLHFGDNTLFGTIPSEISKLKNIKDIRLYNNSLHGPIPSEIGELDSLSLLLLDGNTLSGTIPSEIGNLSNMKHLYLFNNLLSGIIPPEIGNLDELIQLRIQENILTGSIPPEIGRLSNLEILQLCDNLLSGSIPPEIGNLHNLEQLSLRINRFSGSIPSEIGKLSNLIYMLLSDNELTGVIPEEIGNIANLEWVYFHNNSLSGPVPASFANLSSLQRFLAGGSTNNICVPITLASWYSTIPYRDDVLLSVCPDPPTSSETDELPPTFALEQNYPNPFNPSTTIEYALGAPGYVELAVYNMAGLQVATIVNEYQSAGRHTVVWHGDAPSGTYLYRLVADGRSTMRYMTLVR